MEQEHLYIVPRTFQVKESESSVRPFEMCCPHIGVSGNVHVEDIAEFFCEARSSGDQVAFRRFLKLVEICEADVLLGY